jgi:selenocysteine lyase/cysteine desulfurase
MVDLPRELVADELGISLECIAFTANASEALDSIARGKGAPA